MSVKSAVWVASIGLALVSGIPAFAADQAGTPFKLGTFRTKGREFIGLVLQDTRVVDIAAADKAFERSHPRARKVRPPADMKELISRYEEDVGPRLRQLADTTAAQKSASYVYAIASIDVLPPVRPAVILNAGANYPEHAQGIVDQAARAAAAAGTGNARAPEADRSAPPGGPGARPPDRPPCRNPAYGNEPRMIHDRTTPIFS